METVEMDLMQAQIGSLATDVSRLEAKVASGSNIIITVDNLTPIDASHFKAQASMNANDIEPYIKKGKTVVAVFDLTSLGSNSLYSVILDHAIYVDDAVSIVTGNAFQYTSGVLLPVARYSIYISNADNFNTNLTLES